MGKAYRIPGSQSRLREQQISIRNLQALNRNRNTPRPVSTTAFSGGSAAGDAGGTGNFLLNTGGAMIGPLALNSPIDFSIEIDTNNTIDISSGSTSEQYTSNIQLEDIQPNTFTLDTIAGAAFDGQILVLRTFAPSSTFTISAGTLANGGNIQTPDGTDVTGIGDLQMIIFIFDEDLSIEENTGGSWRLLNTFGSGGGGGDVSFPITPPVNVIGSTAANQDIDLSQDTAHTTTLTLTGDIDITFSNFPSSGTQIEWEVQVTQDATGGRIVTWPAEVLNAPTLSTTAESVSVVVFRTNDGGTIVRVGNTVTTTAGVTLLSDLGIDVNKDWQAFGISNFGALTGVTGIDMDGTTPLIEGIKELRFFDDDPNKNIQSGTDELSYNVPALDQHSFYANSVEIARFVEAASGVYRLDMLDNQINNAQDISFDNTATFAGSGAVPTIGFDDDTIDRFIFNTPDVSSFQFTVNNVDIMRISNVSMSFQKNFEIICVPSLTGFAGLNVGGIAGDVLAPANGDIHYNSSTNTFRFYQAGAYEELGGTSNEIVQGDSSVNVTDTGTGSITTTIDGNTNITLANYISTFEAVATNYTNQFFRNDPTGGTTLDFISSTIYTAFNDGSVTSPTSLDYFKSIVEISSPVEDAEDGLYTDLIFSKGTQTTAYTLEGGSGLINTNILHSFSGSMILKSDQNEDDAVLRFTRNDTSMTVDDVPIAVMQFRAENSAGAEKEYASLNVFASDVTDASENTLFTIALINGALVDNVFAANTLTNKVTLSPTNSFQYIFGTGELTIPSDADILLGNGFEIEYTSSSTTTFDVPSGDILSFAEAGTQVGKYDGSTDEWTFNPAGDINLVPTNSGDIILDPDGEITVTEDIVFQNVGATVDFAATGTTPVGSAIGAIVIRVNGTDRLIKFYST